MQIFECQDYLNCALDSTQVPITILNHHRELPTYIYTLGISYVAWGAWLIK